MTQKKNSNRFHNSYQPSYNNEKCQQFIQSTQTEAGSAGTSHPQCSAVPTASATLAESFT